MFRKSTGADLPTVLPNGRRMERGFSRSLFEAHKEKMAQQEQRGGGSTASTASTTSTASTVARYDTPEATHGKPSAGGTSGTINRREKQRASSAPRSHKPYTGGPKLPKGWSATKTKEGETFYMNHISKTTTWDLPVAEPSHATNTHAPDTSNKAGSLIPGMPGHTSRLSTSSTASTTSGASSSSTSSSATSSHRRAASASVRSNEAGSSSARRRAGYKSTISVEETTVRGLISGKPKFATRSPAQHSSSNSSGATNSTSAPSSSSSNCNSNRNSNSNSTISTGNVSNSSNNHGRRTSPRIISKVEAPSSDTRSEESAFKLPHAGALAPEKPGRSSRSRIASSTASTATTDTSSSGSSGRHSNATRPNSTSVREKAAQSSRHHSEEGQPSGSSKESGFQLPDGWGVAVSRGGQRYYVNLIDNTTTWERPRCLSPNGARGSTSTRSSPSTTASGWDNISDRQVHSNGDETAPRTSTTGVPQQVQTGEATDATLVEPPRRHSVARVTSGGAVPPPLPARPPALPARPVRDPNTAMSQGGSAPSASGFRDASHGNSSNSRKPRGNPDIIVEKGGGAGAAPPRSSAVNDPKKGARTGRAAQNSDQSADSATSQATETGARNASSPSEQAKFNPALFGISEGTRVPVDLQQDLMKNYPKIMRHATAQNERAQDANTRGTFSKTLFSGANKALTRSKLMKGLGKGMGKLIKGMATGQNVNQPTTHCDGTAEGGFSTTEGFSARDLELKLKKASTYSSSGSGKKEKGETTTNMVNGAVEAGLDLAGVGDSCGLKLKKNKKGERKWKGEMDLSSESSSEPEHDGEGWDMQCEEVEVEVEVNIEVDADAGAGEEEEGEEEEGEEHEEQEGGDEENEKHEDEQEGEEQEAEGEVDEEQEEQEEEAEEEEEEEEQAEPEES